MGLVNQTLPGLYNGVSQQPDELRLDTQVSEMINCHPSLVQGLHKRNPSVALATDNTVTSDAFIHVYDRGAGDEQYIINVKDGYYKVYDEAGTQAQDWVANSYLSVPAGTAPREAFSAVTVGDTTFIVNKTKTVAMDTAVDNNGDASWDQNFYYWVKRTTEIRFGADNAQAKGYSYYVYNNTGGLAATATGTDGVVVASSLATSIGGTSKGSVVKKTVATGTYAGDDSWGSQASESWQGSARKLQDLPGDLGFQGAVIEISGDEDSNFDSFYVKYEGSVYRETFKPGLQNSINNSTMPHQITRASTTSFPMTTIDWTDRAVGDVDSAAEPSFIGKTIDDVFFFKNRLGLLAQDNIVMSETGEFFNFFPTTVTDVLDSDPIDVAVDSNKAVHLRYAIPFNKELLVFGDEAQFILSSAKTLTPKDVNVQQSTAFAMNRFVTPFAIGPNVYFATDKANSSLIREYFTSPDSISNDAANITAHCPFYLPNNLTKLTGSSKYDMLFAITGTNNKIYVYNFYWQGEEKAQSAWHTWEIESDETIFNIEVLDDELLVMVEYDNGDKKLESISLELPEDINTVVYEDSSGDPVSSTVQLSKWGVPDGKSNVDSNRSSLILRDLRLSVSPNSYYGLEIVRGTVTRSYNNYVTTPALALVGDDKFPVVGNADNLTITINSQINKGFKLNSLSWRGQLHLKGSRGI
jgi:hypothetical protein